MTTRIRVSGSLLKFTAGVAVCFAIGTWGCTAALFPKASGPDSLSPPTENSRSSPPHLGLEGRVVEHRLSNGLRILMVERRQAPVVSFAVAYGVGGVNERPGITGVAHFYEHLAFKGTQTLGTRDFGSEAAVLKEMDRAWADLRAEEAKGAAGDPKHRAALEKRFSELQKKAGQFVIPNEIGELYERNGGVGLNATTAKDLTRYVVSLPSNRMELWAAIESDRMSNPVLREFYKEKDVVLEERRMRYENSPSGSLYEAFVAAAFTAHPYGLPVIGFTSDLEALSRTGTRDFFKEYYSPGNAVIAVAGDIDIPAAIRLMEKYFGPIPAQPPPPAVTVVEPPQRGERRVEVEFDAEPAVMIGYRKPGMDHPDDAVFDVIDSLLSSGRTSRLFQSLVKEKGVAVSVGTRTGVPGAKFPHLFLIQAVPRAPHTPAEVEAAVYEELDRLKKEPIRDYDLEKILNQLNGALIRSLDSNSGLASQLSFYQTVAGDWRYILRNRDAVGRVTPEDVTRVARAYFTKSNRVVATLVRKEHE